MNLDHAVQPSRNLSLCRPGAELESTDAILTSLVQNVAKQLGYLHLNREQEQSIIDFVKGRDVLVSLPTGYGKLCVTLCCPVFLISWKVEKKCVYLVASSPIALMQDQVKAITDMVMSAVRIMDKEVSMSTEKEKLKKCEVSNNFDFS